jgi:hypothetical protein
MARINNHYTAYLILSVCLAVSSLSATGEVQAYSQGYYQGAYYSQSYYQGSYYSQGTYYAESSYDVNFGGGTSVPEEGRDVYMDADVDITGSISKGAGTFVIDHPLDPANKLLYHSFVESPDVKNIYDGIATLDANGRTVVKLPEYFEALNEDYRFLITPLEVPMPDLFIESGVINNEFIVAGGAPNGEVAWQVTGNRQDPYIKANPILVEVKKGRDALVAKGEFVSDEARRAYESVDTFFEAWFNNVKTTLLNLWRFIAGIFT